ncbi:murein L,D-transpeptidase catalytic domain family protein [Taibaiella soli]|uniref:Murein L,D-transpeptidase catalytic domain family protein n=1 Tax=Taibaiella soli TaxID=1649169 RepID=A0A2W2BC96_9BACT|nr:murein L,D-transpeptidase catalytic domain family protein [Taibaiella soli]PZF73507.1 hypothetical protein DN068_07215 [Taibaiella soli]
MKKFTLCIVVCLLLALQANFVFAGSSVNDLNNTTTDQVATYIKNTYKQIAFPKNDTLDYDIFDKAMHGYINLRNAGKLNQQKNLLTVCDLTRSSNDYRLWIIDLDKKTIVFHTYVAHGQGSGEEFAKAFSNRNNSHQTSLGFYVTGETYEGEHGTSLKLNGMDNGFNSAAFDRGIVVHGADYVCKNFIADNQRLGRSWGCPAVPSALSLPIINTIKDGTCLFIYYPQAKYLHTAFWLNKKIEHLPMDDSQFGIMPLTPEAEATRPQASAITPAPAMQQSPMPAFNADPGAIRVH